MLGRNEQQKVCKEVVPSIGDSADCLHLSVTLTAPRGSRSPGPFMRSCLGRGLLQRAGWGPEPIVSFLWPTDTSRSLGSTQHMATTLGARALLAMMWPCAWAWAGGRLAGAWTVTHSVL